MDKNYVITTVGVFIFLIIACSVLSFGVPIFHRYQAIKYAQNQVLLNEIQIHQTEQLIQVEKQKAQIRTAEAEGIASAQKIINATLTDRYLQHEAIQAQLQMANSPNHTQIYIPTGNNGIPLVRTVNDTRAE